MSSVIDMATGFSSSFFTGAGWVLLGVLAVLIVVVVVIRNV